GKETRDHNGRSHRRASSSVALYAGGVWLDYRSDARVARRFYAAGSEAAAGPRGDRGHGSGAGAADRGRDRVDAATGRGDFVDPRRGWVGADRDAGISGNPGRASEETEAEGSAPPDS